MGGALVGEPPPVEPPPLPVDGAAVDGVADAATCVSPDPVEVPEPVYVLCVESESQAVPAKGS